LCQTPTGVCTEPLEFAITYCSISVLRIDPFARSKKNYRELIGLELGVQFLTQVNRVSFVAERDLLILGPGVVDQDILAFEIDGAVVVEHGPDTFAVQDLVAFVVGFIYML
jgi:hypothetical protein